MPIEASVAAAVVVSAILCTVLVRSIYTIQPGRVGLVFLLGSYVTTLKPGLNLVSALSRVRKVKPGSGGNAALALTGTALTDLGPMSPPGEVQLENRRILARAKSRISSGTIVTVIDDESPGVVLVGVDRRTASSQHSRTR